MYDDLEADHPASRDWYIHSPQRIAIDASKDYFYCTLDDVSAAASFFSSQPVQWALAGTFAVPAENWMQRRDSTGRLIAYENDQWHLKAATTQRLTKSAF